MTGSTDEHLLNHLRDVHALELQELRQLERAARRRDEETQSLYAEHLEQTQGHEQRIRELVESNGHEPSPVEDKTLRGGTIGLRQLADIALDTPAKLAMNLFALEHLQVLTYELLVEIAGAVDDQDAKQAAEEILEDKRAAAEKVGGTFDRAVETLLEDSDQDAILLAHLRDVHAIEQQSLQLLQAVMSEVCDEDELEEICQRHLEQTEQHEQLINERIESHDAKPSAVKDLHAGAATAALHELSDGPPDAHPKASMNLFCVEQLEVAAYELLIRIAERCDDKETAETAKRILGEERETAEAIEDSVPRLVEIMLQSDSEYATARAAGTAGETETEAEPGE